MQYMTVSGLFLFTYILLFLQYNCRTGRDIKFQPFFSGYIAGTGLSEMFNTFINQSMTAKYRIICIQDYLIASGLGQDAIIGK